MALRLRLKFHRGILTHAQLSHGLKRSWILVNPQHDTISEVASHLLHAFNLYNTCPNGLLLYIDDFVLPPFTSTSILKDRDLICVKRKEIEVVKAIQECREETAYLEYNVSERKTLKECPQLLPNEELGKEIELCECENEENGEQKEADVLHDENVPNADLSVKKRKSLKEHKSPKRKRQRLLLHNNDEQEDQREHHGACLQNVVSSNRLLESKQDHSFEADGRKRQCQVLQGTDEQEKLKNNHGACSQNGGHSKKLSKKAKQDQTPEEDGRKKHRKVLHDNDEQEKEKMHHDNCLQNEVPSNKLSKTKQDHAPEADANHKAIAIRKKHRKVLHDNDEQEKEKMHYDNCLQNEVPSNKLLKTKQDHAPEADANHKAIAICNTLDDSGDGTVTPSGRRKRIRKSRSSKRKKAKRKWITAEREKLLKKQSLDEDSNVHLGNKKDNNLVNDSDLQPDEHKDPNLDTGDDYLQPDEDSDTENETVPIVVRPGHIRFASPGIEEGSEHDIAEKEPFRWSGTLIKKKGQKWGRENQSASKWNENRAPYEKSMHECSSPEEQLSHSIQHNSVTPSTMLENAPSVDYENLVPLTNDPVEGDIIAYRLVELSSSFCPELTEYRIGKVSWFDPESQRVMVAPAPEYPFDLRKSPDDDTSEELLDTSSYNEDGTLEIEFQSLVDVRIIKGSEVRPTASLPKENGVSASSLDHPLKPGKRIESRGGKDSSTQAQSIGINENGVKKNSPVPENGAKDAWEDISAALSAKKAELVKKDSCNSKRSPWPYRAMRRSAMGPTLALLRAQNNCQTE